MEVISPFSSTTLPLPPSVCTIHSPAARPIFLLSAPMKQVNLSPSRRRSSTITGMPACIRLGHRLGQRRASLGLMMMQVHPGADELLDVRPLFERVVLGVLEDDLQVRVLVGGGLDVRVHLHAPRLAQIALAHADGIAGLGFWLRAGAGGPPGSDLLQPVASSIAAAKPRVRDRLEGRFGVA